VTANDIRKKYLDFLKKNGHQEIPSASLVPENDPSTLFTSSGMQPLVPYLLGEEHPMGKRLVDSQKSFRTQDIMEVGDNRHTTFFEMLGNWSLGDYFKKEQLRFFFEFLTKEIGLDPKKLYVTVFRGNTELGISEDAQSIEIWKDLFKEKGIETKVDKDLKDGGRIFSYDASKNWWSRSGEPQNMPVGEPGGPDSEVFFDFGEDLHLHENSPFKNEKCHPNCDCGRFLEIGNSVFMEYLKTEKGLEELKNKNVDFGGGLERIVAAVNDTPDVFATDLFLPIIDYIVGVCHGKPLGLTLVSPYKKIPKEMRIIADHLRASVFLIADGVYPSNKLQGYFLRRLLRRAMLYGNKLGFEISGETLIKVAEKVFEIYKESPFGNHLQSQKDEIKKIINEEGDKFAKSLAKGLREIEKTEKLDGKTAFKIYETYGFPLELLEEIAEQKGQIVDKQIFESEFKKHQELSRTSSAGMFKGGLQDSSVEVTRLHTATHLLHQALRVVLGNSVSQKGSNITKERLRFDFSWGEKISASQISRIEDMVNQQIKKELPVTMKIMTLEEAKKEGVLAFFGEKYGEKVKVYSVGSFSKEVCGGPHVENTKELHQFSIMKEEAVAAGVRRIYAKLI
jgi:alanyl-tRNA synthetase